MRNDDRTPILVGAGQLTQRDVEFDEALEPAAMIARAARGAADDAGIGVDELSKIDSLAIVNMIGWHYGNAPAVVAHLLGAHPSRQVYTTVGGNTPQWLVNETARRIAVGETELALLGGAEAMYSQARARKARIHLSWSTGGEGSPTMVGANRQGTSDQEMAYGLMLPIATYPLFENALRVHYGRTIEAHRQKLGELCSRFTQVASRHPHAWFRQERNPQELTTVTADNRYIGFPYPKLMNSILDVDQAAAVLMTSVGHARRLGIDPSRWVYLWGCGDASDLWFVSDRVDYFSSPAIRAIGTQALAQAGLTIEAMEYLDLYSCFPAAVQIGRDMLGIAEDDPRPLTVTGGLPYHGGPGNNYVTHSIATMMDRVRQKPGSKGLVTGLGWYITKHSLGIYSNEAPDHAVEYSTPPSVQAALDAMPHPALVTEANGRATVETYTVLHGRDGLPMRSIFIGRLDDGNRFLAGGKDDASTLEWMTKNEVIGRSGKVHVQDGMNLFELD